MKNGAIPFPATIGGMYMSLVKNLKRKEVEIFGAKRVVRNIPKNDESKNEKQKKNVEDKLTTKTSNLRKTK